MTILFVPDLTGMDLVEGDRYWLHTIEGRCAFLPFPFLISPSPFPFCPYCYISKEEHKIRYLPFDLGPRISLSAADFLICAVPGDRKVNTAALQNPEHSNT